MRPTMGVRAILATIVFAAMAAAGCAQHSNANSDAANTSPTQSVADSKAVASETTDIPLYPGARKIAGMPGTYTSTDPYDVVYAWYKAKLPAGSAIAGPSVEGVSTVVFSIAKGGATNGLQLQGARNVAGAHTTITIVKNL